MNRDEATEYLIDISYKFGNISVEYLTEKDGEKMREAINVLTNEQQTCEDAVSRQAVLDIFANNSDAIRPYSKTWEEVKALPSVNPQPKTGWIPVSERLPEKKGRYLTTIFNEYDNSLRYIMTCDYLSDGSWCPDDECASSNVVAWMPLPKPYELQESEVSE